MKASKEMWTRDTGKEVIKTAGKAVVACGALVVLGVTLGAVDTAFSR